MHDLFVLFGTLGGIAMFGLLGIIIGPIVAALFITVWEIYGDAFRDQLPDVGVVLRAVREECADWGEEGILVVEEDLNSRENPATEEIEMKRETLPCARITLRK